MTAWEEVAKAVSDGRLTKQPCEVCGTAPAVAHHDDYARPLEVRWLCRRHHGAWHAANQPRNKPKIGSVLIRVALSPAEWTEIRKLAIDRAIPVSHLVGDTLRESLLKGAKP